MWNKYKGRAWDLFKRLIILISVICIWSLVIEYVIGVPSYDDNSMFYIISGTILTYYLYGQRKKL
jgi:hypothetical protein